MAKLTINWSPTECPNVSFAIFRLLRSNIIQATFLSRNLKSWNTSSHLLLLGSPVWASRYAFCSSTLFFLTIIIACIIWIIISKSSPAISITVIVSIKWILSAMPSEYLSAADTVWSASEKYISLISTISELSTPFSLTLLISFLSLPQ